MAILYFILRILLIKNSRLYSFKLLKTSFWLRSKKSESDLLLSISNKLTGKDRSLPSKVFEYIATGKPIIHIHGGENDSAIEYLEKYELSCIINPSNNIIENANTLVDFIEKNKRKRLDFDLIKNLFNDNTPEYTADIIKTFIQNNQWF